MFVCNALVSLQINNGPFHFDYEGKKEEKKYTTRQSEKKEERKQ